MRACVCAQTTTQGNAPFGASQECDSEKEFQTSGACRASDVLTRCHFDATFVGTSYCGDGSDAEVSHVQATDSEDVSWV